jgi:hypothetical protein
MFKFTMGAVTSALFCYVLTKHPELVKKGVQAAREQLAVATRNLAAATSSEHRSRDSYEPDDASPRIHSGRARALAGDMEQMSHDELWAVMDDSDFDRRAAASQILLSRADIPASSDGIQVVKERYFRSGKTDDLKTGFSYLGLLAMQPVPEDQIKQQSQRFVERHPRHEACDYAVWSLGELGSEDLIPYFFQIIEDPGKYGPVARERAFCCLAQCGRYSPRQRAAMVPEIIRTYDNAHEAQTRTWCMQALSHCAPGAQARSIDDWKRWASRQ